MLNPVESLNCCSENGSLFLQKYDSAGSHHKQQELIHSPHERIFPYFVNGKGILNVLKNIINI